MSITATAYADVRAVAGPTAFLLLSCPIDPARAEAWEGAAREMTAELRDLPPVPAESECANLTAGIRATETEIAEAEARLSRVSTDVADAVARGKDPSAVEERAQAAAARLTSLKARLGPLEAKLRTAQADRTTQQADRGRAARERVRVELQARMAAAVARLGGEAAVLSVIDEVAAVGVALGMVGPTRATA